MIAFISTGAANRTKQEILHYFLGLLGFFVVFLVVFAVTGAFLIKSSFLTGWFLVAATLGFFFTEALSIMGWGTLGFVCSAGVTRAGDSTYFLYKTLACRIAKQPYLSLPNDWATVFF
jgi:hypothetical protein